LNANETVLKILVLYVPNVPEISCLISSVKLAWVYISPEGSTKYFMLRKLAKLN